MDTERVPFNGEMVTTDVRSCARCTGNHDGLVFVRQDNPADPDYPFLAECPSGMGSIMLRAWEA